MKRRGGFTLLEVVVGLALLGLGLAAVMQIFSGGLKNIYRIEMAHQAMSHAEYVMNEILTDEEIRGPTHLSDTLDENFHYVAEVSDWQEVSDLGIETAESPLRLLSIDLKVYFTNNRFGKYYQLRCLKAISSREESEGGLDPIQQLFRR